MPVNLLLTKFLALFFAFFQVPGQTPVGIFSNPSAFPGAPAADASLLFWISADCATWNGSTCSTYANNTAMTAGNNGWNDRSGTNNTAHTGFLTANHCTLLTGQTNGLPAVFFDTTTTSCGMTLTNAITTSAATWTIFVAYKRADTSTVSLFTSCDGNSGNSTNCIAYGSTNSKQNFLETFDVAQVGSGTASPNTSFHVQSEQYTAGGAFSFLLDGAADNSGTSAVAPNAQIATICLGRAGGSALYPCYGYLSEMLIYSSSGTALSGAKVTQTTQYLRHKYGQI